MGDVAPPSDAGAAGGNLAGLLAGWHPQTPNINVLGALQQGQALEQARLQNQQVLAQRAAGMDYERSINPLTGEFDEKAYAARLAQDPTAAFAAQKADANALANAHAAFNLHLGQMETLGRMAYNLAATKAPRSQINDALIDGVTGGILSPSQAATQIAELRAMPDDQLYPHLLAAGTQLLDQAHQGRQLLGEQQYINAGNRLVGVRTPVMGQAYASGGSIPLGLSPGDAATPVSIPGPAGTTVEPKGAYAASNGIGGGTAPAQSPVAPNALGSGRAAPASQPAAAPAPAPQSWPLGIDYPAWAKVSPNGQSFIPTGLPAAQKISTDIYNEDQREVSQNAQKQNLLQSIVSEGAKANPGALASYFESLGSTGQELGLANGEQATDLNLMQKNVSQLIAAQAQKLGVPTDGKLSELTMGTPNSKMTYDAIKGAAAQLIGMQNYKAAELKAFDAWTKSAPSGYQVGPAAYADFNQAFQSKVPVAVFEWGSLSPALRQQYWKSLGKSGQQQLLSGMNYAVQNGLISKDALQGG